MAEPLTERLSLIEKLTMTEGWQKLTPTQQKIIRGSLSISHRAFRGRDNTKFLSLDDVRPPFEASQRHIASEYCHTAIAALEHGKLVTNPHAEEQLRLGEHFFDTSDVDLSSQGNRLHHLTSAIRKFGFPCVVQPGVDPKTIQPPAVHSFLALGGGADDQILCWDKRGLGMPYRVRTLQEEYDQYDRNDHWGLRKLRNLFVRNTPAK